MDMNAEIPRLVTAALKGGAGKTFITAGLIAALRKRGLSAAAFKKGPDYIDAGWLGLAAADQCYNLDNYLFNQETVKASFIRRSSGKHVAIVEGNRGLFDGVDSAGNYSTAELAKLLKAPVILIVDGTKVTRTAASFVVGCQALDPDLDLKGVILNRVAGARHETILRQSIEEASSAPVIGSISKLRLENFPQRHLGLLPLYEHPGAMEFISEASRVVEQAVDLDRVMEIARSAGAFPARIFSGIWDETKPFAKPCVRIGILKDSAFQFYYPENLEALERKGARLVEISALAAHELPDIDGLYIGGGFPETHAMRLAENRAFKESLLQAVHSGLPVYAECGGLMYLSQNLRIDEQVYPMVGVFPIDAVLQRKPQGLGYARVEVTGSNPFYPKGIELTGHEFHYSSVNNLQQMESACAFRVLRGHGMDGIRDGICSRNVLATYVHIHALGEPLWAEGIINKAMEFGTMRSGRQISGES